MSLTSRFLCPSWHSRPWLNKVCFILGLAFSPTLVHMSCYAILRHVYFGGNFKSVCQINKIYIYDNIYYNFIVGSYLHSTNSSETNCQIEFHQLDDFRFFKCILFIPISSNSFLFIHHDLILSFFFFFSD